MGAVKWYMDAVPDGTPWLNVLSFEFLTSIVPMQTTMHNVTSGEIVPGWMPIEAVVRELADATAAYVREYGAPVPTLAYIDLSNYYVPREDGRLKDNYLIGSDSGETIKKAVTEYEGELTYWETVDGQYGKTIRLKPAVMTTRLV